MESPKHILIANLNSMDQKSDNQSLHRQAITAALTYNWIAALSLNKQILKTNPNDVDTLNRLARALFEIGKYSQAKKIYQDVLLIDPYNSIAIKNLKKVSSFKKNSSGNHRLKSDQINISPALFLEEPGVTTVVSLVKLAEPQKLSMLSPGIMVNLTTKNRRICVTDSDDNYLGVLPDDMSHLLNKLLLGGNKYQSLIKSVKSNGVSILIRETFRSRKFKNQPSFIGESKVSTYPSDHISLGIAEESVEEMAEGEEILI